MTTATTFDVRRLPADAPDLAAVRAAIGSLPGALPLDVESMGHAVRRPGFALVTAYDGELPVGYAASSLVDPHTILLDPVVLADGLGRLGGDAVARALVDAALTEHGRPWASVAVRPASTAFGVLLRGGWRQLPTPTDATYVLLSGAAVDDWADD